MLLFLAAYYIVEFTGHSTLYSSLGDRLQDNEGDYLTLSSSLGDSLEDNDGDYSTLSSSLGDSLQDNDGDINKNCLVIPSK